MQGVNGAPGRYWVLQNGCPEHHLTHCSPLNFDLTLASLFHVANFLMWVQVRVELLVE